MLGIKEMFGKFFNPEQKQKEDENEKEVSEEARQSEDERIEEGDELRRIAEEQMKGDKASNPEEEKEKKE